MFFAARGQGPSEYEGERTLRGPWPPHWTEVRAV